MDLWADLTGPRLPWRRLRVLVENLPPEAATVRDRMGSKSSWGISEQLLAHVSHLLEMALYQRADPKKRGAAPKPMRTPWTDDRSTVTPDAALAERLRDLAARNERSTDGD